MKVILDEGAFEPKRAHTADAGYDLFSPVGKFVSAHGHAVFDTGVHIQIPYGYAGIIKSKSGLNVKHNILSDGLIDSGYNGSIRVKLYNHGDTPYWVERGDKISQIMIVPILTPDIEIVDELEDTDRGANGFGSTGR